MTEKSKPSDSADSRLKSLKESLRQLPYQPASPKNSQRGIGLIGCGGITIEHLRAYRAAGYRVLAFCDKDQKRAAERRDEFFPEAAVFTDHHQLLALDEVEIVDIATHPTPRPPLVEAALRAGKHVLSQKPFVTDLTVGSRLADLADAQDVLLAVNQNGRWAPHFSLIRHAVAAGLIGQVTSVQLAVNWDHSWIGGTPFEDVRHLILYDFAIHWFDITTCIMKASASVAGESVAGDNATDPAQPLQVFASIAPSAGQSVKPAMLGQAIVNYPAAQASLVFNGDVKFGASDRTVVTGTQGTLISDGVDNEKQQVTLYTADGAVSIPLEGSWFPGGFHGAMAELLCAIEEQRQPSHSARNNLDSLAICFAAVESADRSKPIEPGRIQRLPADAV